MKKYLIITILCISIVPSKAQNNIFGVADDVLAVKESITGNFAIGLVPQYAIFQGMRVDFDFKVGNHQYVTVGPQWYFARDARIANKENVDISGTGINVNYRYFLTEKAIPSGPYFGVGLIYKYGNISYNSTYYDSYVRYENTFSAETNGERSLTVNQGGYDLLLGYQYAFNRFFMDFYLGWSFRLSDYDSDIYGNDWNETIFEPGYTGFLPVAGFRVGILIN